jgi:hypothetical protein
MNKHTQRRRQSATQTDADANAAHAVRTNQLKTLTHPSFLSKKKEGTRIKRDVTQPQSNST